MPRRYRSSSLARPGAPTNRATFGEVAGGHSAYLADPAGLGVEPRRQPVPQLPTELILADRHAEMSARQVAAEHGVKCHKRVTTLLRAHGLEPHHRGRSKGNRAKVRGASVTGLQARLRRRPPVRVPVRTERERSARGCTPAERDGAVQDPGGPIDDRSPRASAAHALRGDRRRGRSRASRPGGVNRPAIAGRCSRGWMRWQVGRRAA